MLVISMILYVLKAVYVKIFNEEQYYQMFTE